LSIIEWLQSREFAERLRLDFPVATYLVRRAGSSGSGIILHIFFDDFEKYIPIVKITKLDNHI
jgi:hypothetical protein